MNITSYGPFSAHRLTPLVPAWDRVDNTLQRVVAAGACIIRVGQAFLRQITFLFIRSYLYTTGALSSDRFTFEQRGSYRFFDFLLLKMVPAQFFSHLTHLKNLDLRSAGLKVLPDTISELENLTHLNLHSNALRSLPDGIGSLRNLENLRLDGNDLNVLPDSIGRLAKLRELSVSYNQLRALPNTIGDLGALTSLNAEGNRICDLPNTIGKALQMSYLNLVGNPLHKLPEELDDCLLTSLHLGSDQIHLISSDPDKGIGRRFFRDFSALSAPDRREILTQGARVLPWGGINNSIFAAFPIFNALARVDSRERRSIVHHLNLFVDPHTPIHRVTEMIREMAPMTDQLRANYVRARLNAPVLVPPPAEGIDVHSGSRDARTRAAIEKLRAHQKGIDISSMEARAVEEFRRYLNASAHQKGGLAKRALHGKESRGFGPFLTDHSFMVHGLQLTGSEIIARLWTYASTLESPDDGCAKDAMISALASAFYADGSRVCDPGKTQRLIVAVLQGRLPGVNIDEAQTLNDLINNFFSHPDNQIINNKRDFAEAMRLFRSSNPSFNQWEQLESDLKKILVTENNDGKPWV
ncbi:MAG: leucine-rich repeat domain-containing protein [Chlamydiia bacterium]|nr:leucine-rich repeat domain-containing protein [Chlamydiia bacterium]